jgi:hypothetical protein
MVCHEIELELVLSQEKVPTVLFGRREGFFNPIADSIRAAF